MVDPGDMGCRRTSTEDLAEQLRGRGITPVANVIPSIRCIEEVT